MADKIFPPWMYVNKPNDKAPEFIKCDISFQVSKLEEFVKQAKENADEKWYVRYQALESKDWKWYPILNDYKPEKKEKKDNEFFPF